MPSAVSDANVVIGLAKGEVFPHLAALYSPIYVPPAVRHEVIDQGQGRPGEAELAQALGSWIVEVAPDPAILQTLPATGSVADREVLAVALERGTDHILSDDGVVRREAAQRNRVCLQTPQVVVLMKDQGLISEVKPVLDRMRQRGFGIEDGAYQQALQGAGEQP
jgi:uncharacterized protein